ncbi:MAG: peptidoglycan endopeptidase [Verrucomicrobiaceae bacterium]|nr:MAG: peptidoglycan endopeptidase [Verrucomicrobiaceae bacterium]
MAITSIAAAEGSPRPGSLKPEDLKEYTSLGGMRKRIVDESLQLAAKDSWLKYQFGSADPSSGGLDCSGAVFYILQRVGVDPPRSSAAQFTWVKEEDALTEVSVSVTSIGDAAFKNLKPGDLLFWSGTYEPTDGRSVSVSHVQIFLGHEKATGEPVMVGSSDGRTYLGTKRGGYGVFDFKLPKPESKAKFLGYGLPKISP